ncbi:unnamed protein product [Choristocarpus tenellus]
MEGAREPVEDISQGGLVGLSEVEANLFMDGLTQTCAALRRRIAELEDDNQHLRKVNSRLSIDLKSADGHRGSRSVAHPRSRDSLVPGYVQSSTLPINHTKHLEDTQTSPRGSLTGNQVENDKANIPVLQSSSSVAVDIAPLTVSGPVAIPRDLGARLRGDAPTPDAMTRDLTVESGGKGEGKGWEVESPSMIRSDRDSVSSRLRGRDRPISNKGSHNLKSSENEEMGAQAGVDTEGGGGFYAKYTDEAKLGTQGRAIVGSGRGDGSGVGEECMACDRLPARRISHRVCGNGDNEGPR